MSRHWKRVVLLAAFAVVFAGVGPAKANHVNDTINRRQHPGHGFHVNGHVHHVQAATPVLNFYR